MAISWELEKVMGLVFLPEDTVLVEQTVITPVMFRFEGRCRFSRACIILLCWLWLFNIFCNTLWVTVEVQVRKGEQGERFLWFFDCLLFNRS